MITDITDYPALKKLASALWGQETDYHGAAVMIGSGFSRSAAITVNDSKKPPLWSDLSKALARDLNATYISDPLRLAEEYSAYFGKQALNDLIKKTVNDAAWQPGDMHKMLLELPWSELLTTNWDTLLERAATLVPQTTYSMVSRPQNLASTRSPRITKLHGTINVSEELVFTQEDYRQYPKKYAAFVNFARQVFIENELCLLGFSGDDPNFLQWTGWVRDNLATHARRIYLVGALDLTAAKRKYFESINIAAIDLSDLVEEFDPETRHKKATELFLQELKVLKPKPAWDWMPTCLVPSKMDNEDHNRKYKDHKYAATLLEQQLPTLIKDRKSYPGWLICPSKIRSRFASQITNPYPQAKNLVHLSPKNRTKLLYEIAWRHSITNELLPPWLTKELLGICDPATPNSLSKQQQMEIALLVLKNTRWANYDDDESQSVEKIASNILKENSHHWHEAANELTYHQALVARDSFDYAELEQLANSLACLDPLWKLRKASLLAELGCYETAEPLVASAYQELLLQHRNDRRSIYIFSRLAWAHWILRGIHFSNFKTPWEMFPVIYREALCDPEIYIDSIDNRISGSLERQAKKKGIEPSFEPGVYRDPSKSVSFGGTLHPILLLDEISNNVGLPLRWDNVSFFGEHATKLVKLNNFDNIHRLPLAVRAASSEDAESIKSTLSRIQVACLDERLAHSLQERSIKAIRYWLEKRVTGTQRQKDYALERLRTFVEILARILLRATPTQAKCAFRFAIELGKNPSMHHFWLGSALEHLMQYALESIPKLERDELLSEALSFPLGIEINMSDPLDRWPNPVIEPVRKRRADSVLDLRIAEIIDRISNNGSINKFSLLRLLPLICEDFLSHEETLKIAEKIWNSLDGLPDTGLLIHALFELPSTDPNTTIPSIRKCLFEIKNANSFTLDILMAIVGASNIEKGIRPDELQAIKYFDTLIMWRPDKKDHGSFEWIEMRDADDEKAHWIGRALSESVIPCLPPFHLTKENFYKLIAFHNETKSMPALIGCIYFLNMNPELTASASNLIRSNLQAQDVNAVRCAALAILKWSELVNAPAIPSLISRLIYLIESGRVIALESLLEVAMNLFIKNNLSSEEVDILVESTPKIFNGVNYGQIDPASKEAVNASIIRTACTRLALAILKRQENLELRRITKMALEDPLPEVRFAHVALLGDSQ